MTVRGSMASRTFEIERRIQKAAQQSATNADLPPAPVGVPDSFEEHIKLMFDLQRGLTRVSRLCAHDLAPAYPTAACDGFTARRTTRTCANGSLQINPYHDSRIFDKLQHPTVTAR